VLVLDHHGLAADAGPMAGGLIQNEIESRNSPCKTSTKLSAKWKQTHDGYSHNWLVAVVKLR